jgi:D-3-phosphoglycerate dehydrogenase
MQEALKSLSVSLGSSDTRFSASLDGDRRISVRGTVKSGAPYLTRIGTFDADLSLSGIILLVSVPAHAPPHD